MTQPKRSEIVDRMQSHVERAEAQLVDAQLHVPAEDISGCYAAATAHATLALFYQGELRDIQS